MSRHSLGFIPSVALLVAAGSDLASAQVRTEVVTRRATPAMAESESSMRRLQRQLDSLTHRYNEADELTVADRRRLEAELSITVQRLAELMSRMGEERGRVMLRAPQAMVMPRGWIGIVAEGPGTEPRVENGELVVRYLSYPRIVSVDPSSPAQRAGITPNDTLLAYDGRDVREHDIYLNRLLRPNTRVNVKLRRDGRTHEVAVTVAEAPSRIVQRRGDEVRDERVLVLAPDAPMLPRSSAVAPSASAGGARGGSVNVRGVMPTPAPGMVFSFTTGGVAGAQMVNISEGLAKRIGVSNGVLVTSAPVGSPAGQSGIEDGDVIIRVAGQAVRTVFDVRRAVGGATENGQRSVELELLRDSRTVKTILRW